MTIEIPEEVIEALLDVRETGRTNMFDGQAVAHLASALGHYKASTWLYEASASETMAALKAMGKRVTAERQG